MGHGRIVSFLARVAQVALALVLASCRAPPWSLRPEVPSRIESLYGAPDEFRLCYTDEAGKVVASKLTSDLGVTPGIIAPVKPQRCDLFRVAPGTLDSPSTVTLETRGADSSQTRSEQVPLTARGRRWVPHSPVDVASRMLYLVPLSAGDPNLLQLHSALRYRLTPAVRVGGGLDASRIERGAHRRARRNQHHRASREPLGHAARFRVPRRLLAGRRQEFGERLGTWPVGSACVGFHRAPISGCAVACRRRQCRSGLVG